MENQSLIFCRIYLLVSLFFMIVSGCHKDDHIDNYKGYPVDVGNIFLKKCATSGCHNNISKDATNGLSLESWTDLLNGSRNANTAIIPYKADLSYLMYYVNTYSDLGVTNQPVMPLYQNPLSREEVIILKNWINNGAKARNGLFPFHNLSHYHKMFIINQGCDNVFIVDAESGLILRSIDVGAEPIIESPHYISMSRDNKHFFICFTAGKYFQKFNSENGQLEGQTEIGIGSWNSFTISEDNRYAFIVDWTDNGKIAVVDIQNMKLEIMYQGSGLLNFPHGSAIQGNWLYVTAQTGNFLYKIDISDIKSPEFYQVVLQPGEFPVSIPSYDPHQIHFTPDGKEYVVSCQGSNEVRFFDTATDNLIARISTGKFPQHPHFSHTTDYLFVTCMEDDITFPGTTGSVSIINYKTHTFVKHIFTGWQPHGNIIDDEHGRAYILNRNFAPGGPAPHHTSACGGRNGYMTAIDMNTLEIVKDFKPEMSVDPYAGALYGHFH